MCRAAVRTAIKYTALKFPEVVCNEDWLRWGINTTVCYNYAKVDIGQRDRAENQTSKANLLIMRAIRPYRPALSIAPAKTRPGQANWGLNDRPSRKSSSGGNNDIVGRLNRTKYPDQQ